jgi:hypothetical protein
MGIATWPVTVRLRGTSLVPVAFAFPPPETPSPRPDETTPSRPGVPLEEPLAAPPGAPEPEPPEPLPPGPEPPEPPPWSG